MGMILSGIEYQRPFIESTAYNGMINGQRIWGVDYFRMVNAGTVRPTWKTSGPNLEYSLDDGENWTSFSSGTTISTGGNTILFRGLNRTAISDTSSLYSSPWVVTRAGTDKVNFYGDIRTILNYTSLPNTLGVSCFSGMFYNQTNIGRASVLLAKNLAQDAYELMYAGCTGLTHIPAIYATYLPLRSCYGVFKYCPHIRINSSRVSVYQYPWRIPWLGDIAGMASFWGQDMFDQIDGQSGQYGGEPVVQKQYYATVQVANS